MRHSRNGTTLSSSSRTRSDPRKLVAYGTPDTSRLRIKWTVAFPSNRMWALKGSACTERPHSSSKQMCEAVKQGTSFPTGSLTTVLMPLSILFSPSLSGCPLYTDLVAMESHQSLLDLSLLLAREACPLVLESFICHFSSFPPRSARSTQLAA